MFADDLADRCHLGGRPGQKDLLSLGQFLRHDRPLDHLDAAFFGQANHSLAGDAIKKAIRRGGVQFAVDHQEEVGAGTFSELATPVEHKRIVAARGFGVVLRHRADHVKPGCLGLGRRGVRRRSRPRRPFHADALGARFRREISRPVPGGESQVDLRRLRRDTHLLGAAPGNRSDVAVEDVVR